MFSNLTVTYVENGVGDPSIQRNSGPNIPPRTPFGTPEGAKGQLFDVIGEVCFKRIERRRKLSGDQPEHVCRQF